MSKYKPQIKRRVGIRFVSDWFNGIDFCTDKNTLNEMNLEEFGFLRSDPANGEDCYHLTVDARYNLKEVVQYIKSFNRLPINPTAHQGGPQMANQVEVEIYNQAASFYTCDSSFGELINLLQTMTQYISQHPELDGNIETIKVQYGFDYWAGWFSLFDTGPLPTNEPRQ